MVQFFSAVSGMFMVVFAVTLLVLPLVLPPLPPPPLALLLVPVLILLLLFFMALSPSVVQLPDIDHLPPIV
ncbi:hypothetical protein PRUPE_7G039200 [Prunus persica]|uniref:Uncharacterized protein n=1 Tax=Prunus persica TaxID=3760 RepID=A0A251N6D5_PRUPE|nr:hypothetical protein PRUPE_7G039200 [Prunus persica]